MGEDEKKCRPVQGEAKQNGWTYPVAGVEFVSFTGT